MTAIAAFTPESANRSLVYVSRVVNDVVAQYREVLDMREQLESQASSLAHELDGLYEKAMDRLGLLVDELHAVGVELRDFERGAVEFPAECGGEDMMLRWEPGLKCVAVPVSA